MAFPTLGDLADFLPCAFVFSVRWRSNNFLRLSLIPPSNVTSLVCGFGIHYDHSFWLKSVTCHPHPYLVLPGGSRLPPKPSPLAQDPQVDSQGLIVDQCSIETPPVEPPGRILSFIPPCTGGDSARAPSFRIRLKAKTLLRICAHCSKPHLLHCMVLIAIVICELV